MNKVAKGFLVAFAVVAGLTVFVVLGANLYVESHGVHTRLESALSNSLRMPIQLTSVHFTLTGDLKVSGLTIPSAAQSVSGESAQAAPATFLEAPEISARISWRPLFSHRLVIRELLIADPKVSWAQTPEGKWVLPKFERLPAAAKEPEPAHREKRNHVEFEIGTIEIRNASFNFVDRGGRPVAVLEGVTVNCPEVGVGKAEGTATIRRAVLHNAFVLEDLVTPFAYADRKIKLSKLDGRLAGGSVTGAYELSPETEGSPFTVDLLFNGVDLSRLLVEGGSPEAEQKVAGTLHGCLDLYGNSGREKSFAGSGQLQLRGGRMEQYSLLQMIGQSLQIDELTRLELQHAQLDLRVGEGRVFVDSLVMESPNLSLSAAGTTSLDGKLDLKAGLTVNPKITRQLPNWVDANFQPMEGSDRRIIHFGVNGTLSHPQTDLLSVMVGQKIEKQVLDIFRAIKGSPKPKKKRDKKTPASEQANQAVDPQPEPGEAAPSPSASPSGSPSK